LPAHVKLPEASSFILFVPPVAKYKTPPDSVTVQLPKSTVVAFTVVAFTVVNVGLPDKAEEGTLVRLAPEPLKVVALTVVNVGLPDKAEAGRLVKLAPEPLNVVAVNIPASVREPTCEPLD
jgi:hypothetical protein